jgi:hypothetical protein
MILIEENDPSENDKKEMEMNVLRVGVGQMIIGSCMIETEYLGIKRCLI